MWIQAELMYDTIRERPRYVKVPFPIAKVCRSLFDYLVDGSMPALNFFSFLWFLFLSHAYTSYFWIKCLETEFIVVLIVSLSVNFIRCCMFHFSFATIQRLIVWVDVISCQKNLLVVFKITSIVIWVWSKICLNP